MVTSAQTAPGGVRTRLRREDGRIGFGVMLPHFGVHATAENILTAGRLSERLDFDAVWVRDHVIWQPHAHERQDITFVEAMMTLATIGAVTERITLGTAVLIPIRYPLKTAQNVASLAHLAGGRVVAGVGAGHNQQELEVSGLDPTRRGRLVEELMEIMRATWEEPEPFDYDGEVFQLKGAIVRPQPPEPVPIWYGGNTEISVRRAAALCDGWFPGGTPFATLDKRLELLRSLTEESGRSLTVGYIPRLSIAASREEAVKDLDVKALSSGSEGSKQWVGAGEFNTFDDLAGLLLAGTPEDVAEQITEVAGRGIHHMVVDLRSQFEHFEDALTAFAEEVVPRVRAAGF